MNRWTPGVCAGWTSDVDFSHMDAMGCQLAEGIVVAEPRGSDIGLHDTMSEPEQVAS